MKSKILSLVLSFGLICVALAGCGSNEKPSPKSPITLNMWHNYGGDMQQTMDLLIDEFNSTVGKDQGIVINVTAIASSSELNESLKMIVSGDPGAPAMPDICTAYPKVAISFVNKGMLADLEGYFTKDELAAYIPAFIDEGRFDNGLYVFPMAKSTEILYLNQTLFDRFASETGAKMEQFDTMEGLCELSQMYYEWTDKKTPEIKGDGKQFYASDSWFNMAQVGMKQLGESLIVSETGSNEANNYQIDCSGTAYAHIFETLYTPAVKGGIAIYDGYSSDLSKTGDLVCSTGSSAGILFYGDTITYPDNRVEQVEYSILPYPVFKGGTKTAIQRGGGFMVAKTEEKREYAAVQFLKWLTAPAQNMRFIASTGYLPVTVQAFEQDMKIHMEGVEDTRIKKMLAAVNSMYENYSFFTPPIFEGFDNISKEYEKDFKALMTIERERYLNSGELSPGEAQKKMSK
jgi:multiple sugar transport system substrate-binding protein